MTYLWTVIIVVPAAQKASAEQAARAINSTGPDYTGEAFNVALSASGDDPATHYGLSTPATDAMVDAMAIALPGIGGAKFWRVDVAGALVASNVTSVDGQHWGWPESLAASGLVPVSKPFG